MTTMKPVLAAFLIALFIVCAAPVRADPIALKNGKTIDVISVGPGESDHVLAIKYNTTQPASDNIALHEEADAVWDHFAADAGKYDQAILSAVGSDGATSDVTLQKTNGIWHALDFKPGEDKRLTVDIAKDFMRRGDTAMDHDELNAALLYLGDHWTGTTHYKARGGYSSASIANRTQLTEFTSHMAKNYTHSCTIYNVTIAQDGKSAKVESYETESGTLKDRSFSTVEHSLDNLAIENGSIVAVKSLSDVTVEGVPSSSVNKAQCCKPHPVIPSKAEFLRSMSARIFPVSTVCLIAIFSWLMLTRLRQGHLRALVNTGTRVKGTITSAEVYNANARRGIVTGLNVSYQFAGEAGAAQQGSMRVFMPGSSDPASYATGMPADVVYLARRPSVSALYDLMGAKNAALVSTGRTLMIFAPIALLLALASAWYLFG